MIIGTHIFYKHPNGDALFEDLNFSIPSKNKIALVGNNGTGKSTLLKLITKQLMPQSGKIDCDETPYLVPQHFGQYSHLTIAEVLNIDQKINALNAIFEGSTDLEIYEKLQDDWTIEERVKEAFEFWDMSKLQLDQAFNELSGGQKTKVFLAGIQIHNPKLVLMDEPSNHLDIVARQQLYQFVVNSNLTILLVSHDIVLLNLLNETIALSKSGLTKYGGNYDFYKQQLAIEMEALENNVSEKEKAIRKAKIVERETIERQQKLDARGKQKQEKAGVAKIMMNTLRNNAEKSTAKSKEVHSNKIIALKEELKTLRATQSSIEQMRFDFDQSNLHSGKILFKSNMINHSFNSNKLWKENINFQINSGERWQIIGENGAGKSTLLKIIMDEMHPTEGEINIADFSKVYINQEYSLIDNTITVYEHANKFNEQNLEESELKSKLTHFLFYKNDWDKKCESLSGGERMRLLLCCLTLQRNAPDMIVLDEPTNNLDIQNVEILTKVLKSYNGTLLLVTHDSTFASALGINQFIHL